MKTSPVSEKKITKSVTYTSTHVLLDDRHEEASIASNRSSQLMPSIGNWRAARGGGGERRADDTRGSYATPVAADAGASAECAA